MGLGRRKVQLHDTSAWVFNRMVEAYAARPPYPVALVDALAGWAGAQGNIADLGAGMGHLALPLAERGCAVWAVEPARAMLDALSARARERGVQIRTLHAAAEALPLDSASIDLAIIADALHFMDAELAALEIRRVLTANGGLAVVRCELAPTPFMRALVNLMQEAAPRRPRKVAAALAQVATLTGVPLPVVGRFEDATPVDPETLESILRSISFIGPAMNRDRFQAFRERLHALPFPAVWARTFTLHAGRRNEGR